MKMIGKRYTLVVLIVLVTGFIGGKLSTQFLAVESALAQNAAAKKQPPQTIEQQVAEIEKKIEKIEKKVNVNKEDISKYKIEVLASNKLLEISEKNLTAPMWVFGVLITAVALIGSGAIYVFRKGILDRINSEVNKIREEWKKHIEQEWKVYKEKLDETIRVQKGLNTEVIELLAYFNNASLVSEWEKGRLDAAISCGERAVECALEAWGEEPEIPDNKIRLNRYRSNLAYLYAEKKRIDKVGQAIQYAQQGLEVGIEISDYQLIDNYLYIMMIFARDPEDKEQWKKIFEAYRTDIYDRKIRKEGKEQDEYNKYYEDLTQQPSST